MELLKIESEEISVIISYESQKVETFKCKMNDKLENFVTRFASKINVEYSSLFVLYSGKILNDNDLKKTFFQVMNSHDKKEKSMNMLVYRKISNDTVISEQRENDIINIILIIDSKNILVLKGKKENSLKDIINKNAAKIGTDPNSLIFKYGAKEIDLNKKFNDIANDMDKKFSGMTLSVYTKTPIKVNFVNINEDNRVTIECYLDDIIKDACNEYCSTINKNLKSLSFKYGIYVIDINLTFNQLLSNINEFNITNVQIFNETAENYNMKVNKIQEIDIMVNNRESCLKRHKKLLIIISFIIICLIITLITILLIKSSKPEKEPDKIMDTIDISSIIDYSDTSKESDNPSDTTIDTTNKISHLIDSTKDSDNPSDTKKVCGPGYFIPKDDETLENCLKCSIEGCDKCYGTLDNNECISCGDFDSVYDDNNKIIKCNKICETGEEDKCLTCEGDTNNCGSCNIGYKLVKGKCRPDFFIKAVYETKQVGDNIDLYYYPYQKINRMIIDGKNVTPTRSYSFQEKGNHTVYYKFIKIASTTTSVDKFFYKIEKLISVTFSDFDEYIPDLSFKEMFQWCKNLTWVDLSQLSLNFNIGMERMFYECGNLAYVNFNSKKNIIVKDLTYMFYRCKSLISINLSNLDVSSITEFRNMFTSCISLRNINLKNFKFSSATSIYYLFSNCISLEKIVLPPINPSQIKNMEGLFYNCYSLTSINLTDFRTSRVTNMNYLFYNCSSLKFINLSDFNTEQVTSMNSMFEGCSSLTSINFGSFFNTEKTTSMKNFFTDCHSLESMNYPLYVHVSHELSYFFSNCHSLTSINLNNFDTTKVTHYDYMFLNCYSLKSINIANIPIKQNSYAIYMFSGCSSLTSMDFSNFTQTNFFYTGMFFNCPNLHYLDFTIFNSISDSLLFNSNISTNGTLVLYKKFNDYLVQRKVKFFPSNWTLILK